MSKRPGRRDDPSMDDDGMGRLYAHHVPVPPTPTEAMWRVIAAELPDTRDELARYRRSRGWTRAVAWPLAAGIVLAMGVALGRASMQADAGPDQLATGDSPAPEGEGTTALDVSRAYEVLTRERVAGIEPLLAMISADARTGQFDPQLADWAERQLTRTRLALHRPGAEDPAIRALLRDLELILAQVASLNGMPSERAGEELGLIAQALDDGTLLARVRAVRRTGP